MAVASDPSTVVFALGCCENIYGKHATIDLASVNTYTVKWLHTLLWQPHMHLVPNVAHKAWCANPDWSELDSAHDCEQEPLGHTMSNLSDTVAFNTYLTYIQGSSLLLEQGFKRAIKGPFHSRASIIRWGPSSPSPTSPWPYSATAQVKPGDLQFVFC